MTESELIDTCCAGWIHDYVQSVTPVTDAHVAHHIACAYSLLSAVAGGVTIPAYGGLRPTLWTMLVGPSGDTRKGTCQRLAEKTLRAVGPEWLLPQDLSGQRLITLLQAHGSRLQIIEELVRWLRTMEREYHRGDLEQSLELFDSPESWEHSTYKRGDEAAKSPNLVRLFATTPSGIEQHVTRQHRHGGLMGRVLYVSVAKRERTFTGETAEFDWQTAKSLAGPLAGIAKVSGEADLSGIREARHEWALTRHGGWPDIFHGTAARESANVLRLATLAELAISRRLCVTERAFSVAAAWMQFCKEALCQLAVTLSLTKPSAKSELLMLIRTTPGITTTGLSRATEHTKKRLLDLLTTLMWEGSVTCSEPNIERADAQWTAWHEGAHGGEE